MSTYLEVSKRRIFYFNINYSCNNRCVFCYSHNTMFSARHDECSVREIVSYLDRNKANEKDRIIINGGEPLLHSEFLNLVSNLRRFNSEILIYTNGRLLDKLPNDGFSPKLRIIVPIHGNERVHDRITRIPGSFNEMLAGIESIGKNANCILDIKIIINNEMISNNKVFDECLNAYESIEFNGAVHIVKMADTKVSIRNGCASLSNNQAAEYTRILFDFWKNRNKTIKLFDTCIKDLNIVESSVIQKDLPGKVLFKDCHLEKEIELFRSYPRECDDCHLKSVCQSAVDQYRVLEYNGKGFLINLE